MLSSKQFSPIRDKNINMCTTIFRPLELTIVPPILTHQQNGLAKRKQYHLIGTCLALLALAQMPLWF